MLERGSPELSALKVGDKALATDSKSGKLSVIHSTQHHPFWDVSKKAWVAADHLAAGEVLLDAKGSEATVSSTAIVAGAADMWDLTVAQDHDFYVQPAADVSVLAHNCGTPHGDSARSAKPATLYRISTKAGEYLKTGISQNPEVRYSKTFMADKDVEQLAVGSRPEIPNLDRYIVERDPGPLNLERWAGDASGDVPGSP